MALSLLPAFAAELEPEEIAPAEQGEDVTEGAVSEAPDEKTTEVTAAEPATEATEEEEAVTEAPAGAVVDGGQCGDNVYWSLDDAGTLTITGTGAMFDYHKYRPPWLIDYQYDIKSVSIDSGVTSIGNYAFYDCDRRISVAIGSNVTSIGNHAFDSCDILTDVNIPDSVSSIGDGAFSWCSCLTSVTIPTSVDSIGDSAFYFCESLTSISIASGVATIGVQAFSNCESLTNVTIPASVISIGQLAFQSCTSLTRVTIPGSVTSIGIFAFRYCFDLTIYGFTGSFAERYAADNKIPFKSLNPPSLANASVTVPNQTWTGKARTPAPKVVLNGKTLTKGTGYTVSYKNNVKPGKATVTITGKGNYTGTASGTFAVKKLAKPSVKSIQVVSGGVKLTLARPKGAKTLRILCKVGSGKWKKVTDTTATSVTIEQFNGKALQSGKTYAFTVQCVSKKGGYVVSDYYTKGKSILYLTAPALSAPKSEEAGQAVLSWKKTPGAGSYQLQYSASKTFQSGVKTVTVKGLTQTLTKLPGDKVLYFRVRAVKEKTYSPWSGVKSVKIMK